MFKKSATISLVIILTAFVSNLYAIKGSGTVITEQRNLSLFHSVVMNCMGNIIIKDGKSGNITITADDNIMPLIKTVVDKSALTISLTKIVTEATKLEITIPMEAINSLSISGSGKIDIQKKIVQDSLNLSLAGSGNIMVDLETKFLSINLSGSGSIDVYGKTTKLEAEISGSSLLNSLQLASDETIISVSGTAIAKVTVNNRLNVNLRGGTVQYKGTPKIFLKAFFAGNLEAL